MSSKNLIDYARFKRCRNELRALTRSLRQQFESQLAADIKVNPKAFWRYSKSRMKTRSGVDDLQDEDGTMKSEEQEKADILNRFFSSVFTTENMLLIPEPTWQFEGAKLDDIAISTECVHQKLRQLKVTSSPGPDGVPSRVLSETADAICVPLTTLFRQSLSSGHLPEEWRLGTVVPIYKKGCKSLPENYRPISLTSIVCKLLESIVRDQLMDFLVETRQISKNQHGFRPRRSCSTQLLEVIEDWTRLLEDGQPIDTVYLDFKKAFDSVPHHRLLKKLQAYGVAGNLLRWIEAFLSGRKQQVVVSGCHSRWSPVTSGVPQGSVLGPLLFLTYINDIPDTVTSSIKIFADDTKVYRSVSNPSHIQELQLDIDSVVQWSDTWQLPFNEAKCRCMHIGPGNQQHTYMLRGNVLQSTINEKDLGVVIDPDLKFRKQAASAASKATQVLAVIRRSFAHLNEQTLTLLYKALVRPHLEYGNLIWGPFNRSDQKLIERVQRRATKLVSGIQNLPYPQRLQRLRLPSLYYRRRRGDMLAMYQLLHEGVDLDPTDFVARSSMATTRGHHLKLAKPQAVSRVRRNALSIRALNDWNALPSHVVLADTLTRFKSQLDQHWRSIHYYVPIQDLA